MPMWWSSATPFSIRLLDDLRRRTWDLLICDEAQALKTPGSARTRAVYGKGGLARCAARVWLLSGTLAPNNPGELWTHHRVLFGGKLSYEDHVARFCTSKDTAWGRQITGANRAHTAELAGLLRPHLLQRRQEDFLPELPELRWGHIPVTPASVPPQPEMGEEELAILGRLERGEAISAVGQMHLSTLRRWTGVAKAPAVVELMQAELEAIDKIVVFAVHRRVIRMLAQGLGPIAAVIDGSTPQSTRQRTIDAFQNTPLPRVLICQINVAGTALTLHRASRVVFAETTWVPADVAQAAKRTHRIGQRHSVLASVVSLAGSIDEVVGAVLLRKARELGELDNLISRRNAA